MHEPEALEGMIKTIERGQPTFIIEVLNAEIGEKIMEPKNYLFFAIDEDKGLIQVKKTSKISFF